MASKPRAKNSSIWTERQSVVARQRRGRIREKLQELRELVPDAESMDTAALLDEATLYVAFLQAEAHALGDGNRRIFQHVQQRRLM
ncbi:hypothetical protein GOP47_0019487 [Adiantum capillus-veneris]|uniref:BHLH domain-containing protein n=1 Tax=Adiantum capillus-veneris TaxID=13818 RepID=A0A9D4Z8N7_ADICA|nr:hypothetical protein GOP47_0019487 [Adiantum capillus-veneris]